MQTRFEHAYVLNVLSDDHPGIIAAVGRAVNELGGNIDACSQTVLSGYFTLIMVVSLPRPVEPEDLSGKIQGGGTTRGLQVMARRLQPTECAGEGAAEKFVVTAFGTDRPGIILRFSQYLAGKDINIIDMYGGRSGEDFVLVSQVEIPRQWDISLLQADLAELGRELGFTVRLQHENIFVATNQLRIGPLHGPRAGSGE